jgi:hypothetical protein
MMLGRDAVQQAVFVVPHEGQELLTAPRNTIESGFAQGAGRTISGDLAQRIEGQISARVQNDGHLIKAPLLRYGGCLPSEHWPLKPQSHASMHGSAPLPT